jgi:hypothetical protein
MPLIRAPEHLLQALPPRWPPLYMAHQWVAQPTHTNVDSACLPVGRQSAPSPVHDQAKRYEGSAFQTRAIVKVSPR